MADFLVYCLPVSHGQFTDILKCIILDFDKERRHFLFILAKYILYLRVA